MHSANWDHRAELAMCICVCNINLCVVVHVFSCRCMSVHACVRVHMSRLKVDIWYFHPSSSAEAGRVSDTPRTHLVSLASLASQLVLAIPCV